MKKCFYKSAELQAALQEIRGSIAKKEKVAGRWYNIPRSKLQIPLGSKFSKFSMGSLPVLSDDEGQVLVKWPTVLFRKGFP
jgi:hypothetical protein